MRRSYFSSAIAYLLLLTVPLQAATITKPFTFSPGTTISSTQMNACFDTIYNDYNGNINQNNLAASSVGTSQLQSAAVTTAKIGLAAVAYNQIQNVARQVLLGNPTGSATTVTEITVVAPLDLYGGTLSTSVTSGTFVGRTIASKGAVEEITPASYHLGFSAHQLYLATNSVTTNIIAANAVGLSDMAQLATGKLIGNAAGSTADPETVTPASYHFAIGAHQLTLATGSVTNTVLGPNAVNDAKMDTLSIVPVGVILDYGGSSTPTGWLLCDGSEVSRSTYSALFTAIGITWGPGNGTTTFNLPDLRGRATFGDDNMGGSTAGRITNAGCGIVGTTLGAAGGDQLLAAHTHTTGTSTGVSTGGGAFCIGSTGSSTATGSTGSGASANVPPAAIVTKIIKAGV